MPLLTKAANTLLAKGKGDPLARELATFEGENPWVRDSALFNVLTTFHEPTKDKAWWTWEDEALRWRPLCLLHPPCLLRVSRLVSVPPPVPPARRGCLCTWSAS